MYIFRKKGNKRNRNFRTSIYCSGIIMSPPLSTYIPSTTVERVKKYQIARSVNADDEGRHANRHTHICDYIHICEVRAKASGTEWNMGQLIRFGMK